MSSVTTRYDIVAAMERWSEEFIEQPHHIVGDLPVCPFAKAARLKKSIRFEVLPFDAADPLEPDGAILSLVRELPQQSELETLFVIHPEPAQIGAKPLETFVARLNARMAAEPSTRIKAPQGAAAGAIARRQPGALLAGLAAAGVAVPGLPIIAMGPLAAAFAGGATGGVAGAIVGALVGRGIPEERAKLYQRGIDEGGIVFGVTPRSDEDAEYIDREWRDAHGEQIYRATPEEVGRRR